MVLKGRKIYKASDGRFFIKRRALNHYPYKEGEEKNYIRRTYGYVKKCVQCMDSFFTANKDTKHCSDRCGKIGFKNPNWVGGRYLSGGYVMLNIDGEKIREHRYILEKHLGRKLKNYEIIHHKNAIKTDNRLENLEIILQYPKTGLHKGILTCPHCNNNFSIK